MARKVVYGRDATRTLTRMPKNVEDLIRSKIDAVAMDPSALANNVKALRGSSNLRLRVGDWRIVFKIDADQLTVEAVGPRGSIYD